MGDVLGGEGTSYPSGYHVHPHRGRCSPPGTTTPPASLHAATAITPRSSTHRLLSPTRHSSQPHGGPRPRHTPQPTPRPPPPDQAGGSSWQHTSQFEVGGSTWHQQSSPLNPNWNFRPLQFPTPGVETQHESYSGGSGWLSADAEIITEQFFSHLTPPPQPTQETQPERDEQGYGLPPPRQRFPPNRGYSPSPFQPPLRGRTRPHRRG